MNITQLKYQKDIVTFTRESWTIRSINTDLFA